MIFGEGTNMMYAGRLRRVSGDTEAEGHDGECETTSDLS
jgi:hypothetical protein